MFAAFLFVLCGQTILVQSVLSQCISRPTVASRLASYNPASATPACAVPTACGITSGPGFCGYPSLTPATEVTAINVDAFPVTSYSAIPLDTIAVESQNSYAGSLSVAGELPFLGTVRIDGVFSTAGTGSVNHACGGPARLTNINYDFGSMPAAGCDSSAQIDYKARYNGANYLSAVNYPAAGSSYRPFTSGLLADGIGYPGAFGNAAAVGLGANAIARNGYSGITAPINLAGLGSYNAAGEGNVRVAGELPVVGETVILGQVPIRGAIDFNGKVPAYGKVSITAFCTCSCNAPYY